MKRRLKVEYMKRVVRITSVLIAIVMMTAMLSGCLKGLFETKSNKISVTSIEIAGEDSRSMTVGSICLLELTEAEIKSEDILWTVSGDAVTVDQYGIVVAKKTGVATVTAQYERFYDCVEITVVDTSNGEGGDVVADPYVGVSKSAFYENYTPATSFADAYYRTQHGLLSGFLDLPEKEPTVAEDRPKQNGLYVRNSDMCYEDNGNTYVVFDANGNVSFKVYRGAAYITLEEVAAYMFAFGGSDESFPANYTSSKRTSPSSSIWGEYLRVNHSYFIGDTEKYPREPELPNITGCGGKLQYWEMDIGTGSYNNGNKITRGECRLVYGRNDLDGDGVYEKGELHVFYTCNHYDDFREYLNYAGGWGEMFGYETNGASAAKGPSPYVSVAYASLRARGGIPTAYGCIPRKEWQIAA